jgi:hypothetical protein
MSDLFSYGLILYELLTSQSVFSKKLTPNEIPFNVAVKHELPDIPMFVLPSACKLIADCWAEELG